MNPFSNYLDFITAFTNLENLPKIDEYINYADDNTPNYAKHKETCLKNKRKRKSKHK